MAPERTFVERLGARATRTPDRQAFVFLGSNGEAAEELSFSELDRRARSIGFELVRRRLAGERVLLQYPPGLDFVAALFGCFYAGSVAVPMPAPINERMAARTRAVCLDSAPSAALTLRKSEEAARWSLDGGIQRILTDELDARADMPVLPDVAPGDLAMLQYTSGSTGSPKGVMLSHRNLVANSAMIAASFGHDENSRGVSWLPLFHDMGLVGHVLQPVYLGALSVLMSPLTFLHRPFRWLKAISDWKATTSGGPTYAYELCLKMIRDAQLGDLDLSSWSVAYCGSEKVHLDVLERFAERFAAQGFARKALYPCYGLAEATLLATGVGQGSGVEALGPDQSPAAARQVHPVVSCGTSWGDETMAIVDPERRELLPDEEVGEIWVRGSNVAQGYWERPADTEELFNATLDDGEGPFLRTGDLGFTAGGKLYVVGRIKTTIISHGLKHAAEDIEATVARSHPIFDGLPGAAFTVDTLEREQAVLVQEIGRTSSEADRGEAVARAFAAVTASHGLRLGDLMLVQAGSLPRTSSGKMKRGDARDLYVSNAFDRRNPPGGLFPTSELQTDRSDT